MDLLSLEAIGELETVTRLPENANALGVAFSSTEDPANWTLTREKALRRVCRRFGITLVPRLFGFTLTDPLTDTTVQVVTPRDVASEIQHIWYERTVKMALTWPDKATLAA